MAYAKGKYSYVTSDRSGFRYHKRDVRKEWNGLVVGRDEYDSKHPQLTPPKFFADPEAIRNARNDRTEPPVEVLLNNDPFLSSTPGSGSITVTEVSNGRSTGDTVVFRNCEPFDGFTSAVLQNSSGYSITVVTDDTYAFTASGGTATVGSKNGGGSIASAGPVTVEA
tara:strand:+ start:1515 stop:2015 length:501 start_codon:yes stop_codon:yes gene_type:complete